MMRCPCRKKSETIAYADCCEPYHTGLRPAPTAEALMRSRYAAFALGKADHVYATWHASTRPVSAELPSGQEWVQLRVLEVRTEGDWATVEFIARWRNGGRTETLHEVSRFAREGGRWLYVDGETR